MADGKQVNRRQRFERNFFRLLNGIVEPAVRKGVGFPRFAAAGLILLESTGFKTGKVRRTPLVAARWRDYLLVSTFRGERSFWIKNLQQQPLTSYLLAGQAKPAKAFTITPGKSYTRPVAMPGLIGVISDSLAPLTRLGWSFVVLMPVIEGEE